MKCLVDTDIVVFRAAASAENEEEAWIACARADTIIQDILHDTKADVYELWLTGKDNFRYKVFPEYKGNRRDAYRPKWEVAVKDYLVAQWDANWSVGCEADDMLGVRQCELSCNSDESVICTIDKDLKMIPGGHYNFVKKEKFYVSDEEGLRFFYTQLLTGDTTDGIKGVPGIGKVKAEKLLSSLSTEAEYFQTVRDQYSCDEEMLMNARCLWIWRKMGDDPLERFLGFDKEFCSE